MKVKIRKMPPSNKPQYTLGGAPVQGGYSNQTPSGGLNTGDRLFSGSDINPENPFGVKNTLPEAPHDEANINAEKQEMIYGDFDNDGQDELMNVNGPSHAEGGKNVAVPQGAFVYSDTKALKIKDPDILAVFNKNSKKGLTPAQIAKQYDLNKLKAILDNPQSDYLQKNTAKLMMEGYEKKLQQLAITQEALKGFPTGIPNLNQQNGSSEAQGSPQMRYGGNIPKAQYGMFNGPQNQYANTLYPSSVFGNEFTNNYANTLSPGVDNSVPHPGAADINNNPNVPFGYQTPDKIAMALAAAQLASIKKYPGYIAPLKTTLPQTTFYSPEREIAANAEAANTQSMITNLTADGSRGRSIGSSIQGQALSNLGNILAKNQQANVETSNRANQVNADIVNKQNAYNADRLSKLYEQNVISNQAYDNATRQGQDNLLRTYMQSYANRQKLNMLNATSENYYIDPRTGQFVFKGGKGLSGAQSSSQGDSPDAYASELKAYVDALMKQGYTQEQAVSQADRLFNSRRQRTTYSPTNPGSTKISSTQINPQGYQVGPYGQ